MMRNAVLAPVILLLMGGCAIHPDPADVTGVDTVDIVKQIRCEAREALVNIIKTKLADWAEAGSTEAAQLLEQYKTSEDAISDFHPDRFPGPKYVQVRRFINVFAETAIAYSFDLTMSENNDLTTDISLVRPILVPKVTLGIGAGAKRKRSNQRIFTTADTFGYLVTQLNRKNRYNEHYCDGKVVRENFIYPMSGRIGVDKTVVTFIELSTFGGLGGEKGKGPPALGDTLTFTTTVNISASPKVEFTPVTTAFQLANAGVSASADRSDTHKVTVALALGDKGLAELGELRTFAFSPSRGPSRTRGNTGSGLYEGERVTGGGTAAERRAVEMIDQIKRREFQLVPAP